MVYFGALSYYPPISAGGCLTKQRYHVQILICHIGIDNSWITFIISTFAYRLVKITRVIIKDIRDILSAYMRTLRFVFYINTFYRSIVNEQRKAFLA